MTRLGSILRRRAGGRSGTRRRIVLHDPSSVPRPLDEGDSTSGRHRDSEWVLVGGVTNTASATRAKPIDLQPILVDGHSLDK